MRKAIHRRLKVISLAFRLYRRFTEINRLKDRGAQREHVDRLYAAAGRDISETANSLCGAIVKAGQFLSLRDELFPESFTRELESLQENVPPEAFRLVLKSITLERAQKPEELFRHIDEEPIAAGSIAQVHRAQLRDGQDVAVKILRPGIEELVRIDLRTLRRIAHLLKRLPSVRKHMDFVALHREFENTLAGELNMLREASHMERIREALAATDIVVPEVVSAYTTRRMLVMTYVDGASILDEEKLNRWSVDRSSVRNALLDAYLRQLMVTGFVHLDPHPGNLRVLQNGKLALLDFGMVGEYTTVERTAFRNLAQRIFFRDQVGVVRILQDLGFVQGDREPALLLESLGDSHHVFHIETLRRALSQGGVQFQARYMLLFRCVGMLKTVLTILTPEEKDWMTVLSDHALPIVMES